MHQTVRRQQPLPTRPVLPPRSVPAQMQAAALPVGAAPPADAVSPVDTVLPCAGTPASSAVMVTQSRISIETFPLFLCGCDVVSRFEALGAGTERLALVFAAFLAG